LEKGELLKLVKFRKKIEEMTDEEINTIQKLVVHELRTPPIRLLEYHGEKHSVISYMTNELVAVCPMTGIPDYYRLRIIFQPDGFIPELKSLKYYLLFWRDIPIFHEHLAYRIIKDFVNQVRPKWCYLELQTHVRGGIYTNVHVYWDSEKGYVTNSAIDFIRNLPNFKIESCARYELWPQ